MNEVTSDQEICPHCGHKVGDYVMNQRALKPLTVLNGKYLIGKVLGEGGFGITYLGLDLTLNLRVAIKEFFPTQFASRNVYESKSNDVVVISGKSAISFQHKLERYEEEARRLVKLETLPGIVRVLTFFYENNTAYMVMEYIPGENLSDYRKNNKQKIHWNEALQIMEPIINSLSVLHGNEIIHRDISPDNIMITHEKELVLIDFGTAVEIEENDKSKEIELKRGYAPPEQYSSHGNQGPWTDVYEVCATLYYLISGSVLPDAMAIMDKSAKIRPLKSIDSTIPASIEAAIMQGLNVDIKYRTQSMGELYDQLYKGRRVIPWRKISFAAVIFAVALAVILIGVGIKTIINSTLVTNEVDESSDNMEQALESFVQENNSSDNGDSKIEETSTLEDDTAENYIIEKKLSYTDSSFLTYEENDTGITITGADYSLTDIVIPEEIDGKKVTAISGIGNNVTSLVLPDTITSIEKSAFKNCVYLESIYIPSSVSVIGSGAFENCMSLSEIQISSGNQIFSVDNGVITDKDGVKYN